MTAAPTGQTGGESSDETRGEGSGSDLMGP
jgi:hypothetical protein